jgi:sugar lactone lactonase
LPLNGVNNNLAMSTTSASYHKLDAPCCELGEGPHYDRASDTAWWFDIVACKLIEHRFAQHQTIVHNLPRMASFLAPVDAERQLIAMEDGLYLRQLHNGELSLLAELEADNPLTRSNDGRVHPSGRLWIGTMGKRAEPEAGAIYWYDGRELRQLYAKVSIPNSICFSPDGCTGYFTDTALNQVWRVTLDASNGLPLDEPRLFLSSEDLPCGGGFDGSVTDADGVIWNAAWGSGCINGFSPDGKLLHSFVLPAAQTSCPCFVGEHYQQLLVTTAWQGYDPAARAADPGAGFTYVLDLPFNGSANHAFKLP